MPKKLLQEILIPAEYGAAYIVKKGQIQRVIAIEGPQVGDMTILNAHNYKETYDDDMSYIFNSIQGTGTDKTLRYLYSRPPWSNVMLEIIEDRVGIHFVLCGGKCSVKRYELMGIEEYHRNCHDNLAEAIAPFGLQSDDVPDVFNLWMNTTKGGYGILPTTVKQEDYTDFLAHMDCLVALSACPAGDVTVINSEGGNKPLKVEIWE
ncbi:DUF1989 domain-containing protein [Chloroflexota bacterium]